MGEEVVARRPAPDTSAPGRRAPRPAALRDRRVDRERGTSRNRQQPVRAGYTDGGSAWSGLVVVALQTFLSASDPGTVDVATIGLLQARVVRQHEILVEQLRTALNSRIVIEQAKGFVAERLGVDVAAAFHLLRGYARARGRRLTEVAGEFVTRSANVQDLFGGGDATDGMR